MNLTNVQLFNGDSNSTTAVLELVVEEILQVTQHKGLILEITLQLSPLILELT